MNSRPDEKQLMADVRKLLFEDCKNTTTWDHLGNLEPVQRPSTKKVQIIEQPVVVEDHAEELPLPPGLSTLMVACIANAFKSDSRNLRKIFLFAAQPPPPPDHCHLLYERGMDRLNRMKEEDAARKKKAWEEEWSHCTFKPQLSKHAAELPGKGKKDFMKLCVEWQTQQLHRLQKKVEREKEMDETEDDKPWQMNKRSRAILKQAEERRSRSADPAMFKRAALKRDDFLPSFEPITNSATKRERYLLHSPSVTRSVSASNLGRGDDIADPVGTTASRIVQRLVDDAKERTVRKEERQKLFEQRQKERLYDRETGQPLFCPNSLPTKVVNGKRMPFDKLSKEEQQELTSKLKAKRTAYSLAAAKKSASRPRRDINDVIRNMYEQQKRADKEIQKIKRKDERELEGLFKPRIEGKSAEIASSDSNRLPLHLRPAPQRASPPKASPPRKTDDSKIARVLERGDRWQKHKQTIISRKTSEVDKEEKVECTFKPKVSRSSDSMVAAAEARMAAELALLRSKSTSNPSPVYVDPTDIRRGNSVGAQMTKSSSAAIAQSPLSMTSGSMRRQRSQVMQPSSIINVASPVPLNPNSFSVPEAVTVHSQSGSTPRYPPLASVAPASSSPAVSNVYDLLASWENLDRETDILLGLSSHHSGSPSALL